MSVTLSFREYDNFVISESRMEKLLEGDQKRATALTIWEHIKDFFLTDKKKDALHLLFHIIHRENEKDKLAAFNKLSSFATPGYEEHFSVKKEGSDMTLYVGEQCVGRCNIYDLMNIDDDILLLPMKKNEEALFLDMLRTLHSDESALYGHTLHDVRETMAKKHAEALYALYRPDEKLNSPAIVVSSSDSLTVQDKHLLNNITLAPSCNNTLYSRVGYRDTNEGVKFTMVHPILSYLLSAYQVNEYEANGFLARIENNKNMEIYNDEACNYIMLKSHLDKILSTVYYKYDNTLNIMTDDKQIVARN